MDQNDQLHIVGQYINNMNALWAEKRLDNESKLNQILRLCYSLISMLNQPTPQFEDCDNDKHTRGYNWIFI